MKTRIATLFLSVSFAFAFMLTPHSAWAAGTPTSPVVIDLATVSANGDGYTYTSASITTSTSWPPGSQTYEPYTFTDNVVTIIESGWYTITGSTSDKRIVVQSGITANTTLRNATIDLPIRTYACAFDVYAGAVVSLTLDGENILKSGYRCAGLQVPVGATLTIVNPASDITNKLNASGGGDAGTNGGAGIGGGVNAVVGGHITINGGEVTATGGGGGAGIGGGKAGAGGYITINGGKITATGSRIGSTISDFNGGTGSSGIGGGVDGDGGHITINGGEVTATGAGAGAGIGGGKAGAGGDIVITGGIVTATSRDLTGGDNQYSFGTGAGIGGGGRQSSGNIIITGSANVTAQAGKAWSGLGGGLGGVAGSGAGIGSGGGGGGGYSTVGSVNMIVINTTGVVTVNVPTNGDAGSTDQYNGARIGEGGSLNYNGTEYSPLTAVDAYHTVAITQSANGTIVALPNSSETQIVKRANQTYKITPDAGYGIVSVTVDGTNVGAVPYHTIPGIMDNSHTITATFAAMYAASLDKSGTYTFTGATYGVALTPEPITVTNTGLYPTDNLSVVLSGTNAADFTLSASTLSSIAAGGTGSFTVVPNAGLDVGTYAATVTVSDGNSITATFNVSFAVSKATAPSVTFPTTATAVTYGQPLSDATLNITSNAYGDFAWTDGEIKPTVVNNGYGVTFTPNEATVKNYNTITTTTSTVAVTVSRKDLSEATVAISGVYIYNNTAHTPDAENVMVTLTGLGTLISPADYTYEVTDGGRHLGTATVTVTGTGNFMGTATGTFTVVRTYEVTLVSPGTGASGGGIFGTGATVNIAAGEPSVGSLFHHWESSPEVAFANAKSPNTSFTMPESAVTVMAHFSLITYTISVGSFSGGSVSVNKSTGQLGEAIGLTIHPSAGYELGSITTEPAVTVYGTGNTRTFEMPASNVTVHATFKLRTGIVVDENEPAGSNGTGKIGLSLEIPSGVTFSGSFKVILFNGMTIDVNATNLVESLRSNMALTVTKEINGSWLFNITSTALRSQTELSYQKVVDIVYQIDESVPNGQYSAEIQDLNFKFEDGTTIAKSEISTILTVDRSYNGTPSISAETRVYIVGNTLYVDTPTSETVSVYSVSGLLLYKAEKSAGEAQLSLDGIQDGILIVRGSSGWVKKELKIKN